MADTDRTRWNTKYEGGADAPFTAHPLTARALSLALPDGPMLDLASGPSGNALLAARHGRDVLAVDISDVALRRLDQEARRRGVSGLVRTEEADLEVWRPEAGAFAFVLCAGYWDRALFEPATRAVMPGGLLAWEAFTLDARSARPSLPGEWCLAEGEPASLLPAGSAVLEQADLPKSGKRRLLARLPGQPRSTSTTTGA
ncbi:class I SAM-dependent methyltransferase [Actinomadura graeca]|uniref:Class I SAM-dependent methyltransferase n=1 Tax=Actinomadura graeca TaxID=2750812 RepID=A0ABX8QRR0_9ACTN|nr:class I SAM-dependent methyltransferase [Actinomadura graeca]QXJ21318.1 class I SAM-dependent methyltransferase [Actinomadura graeca]